MEKGEILSTIHSLLNDLKIAETDEQYTAEKISKIKVKIKDVLDKHPLSDVAFLVSSMMLSPRPSLLEKSKSIMFSLDLYDEAMKEMLEGARTQQNLGKGDNTWWLGGGAALSEMRNLILKKLNNKDTATETTHG